MGGCYLKIHEIAKKINISSKVVLDKAKQLDIDVKSHLSSVSDEVAKKLLDCFKKENPEKAVKKEKNKDEKDLRTCDY